MSKCKMVPVEPTADMVIAGEGAWDAQLDKRLFAKENGEPFAAYPSEETHELCSRVAYRAMLAAAPAVQEEPVAWQPADEMRFEYRHRETGEAYTVSLSREEVIEVMDQELLEKLAACFCGCEPVGETYVVDCCCDEYADQFELVTDQQPAAPAVQGEPVAWPLASKEDAGMGRTIDYCFLEQVEKAASLRTDFTTSMEAAEQQHGLTEALRQYQHNDGSGLVFGYDKLLVDQHVAQLVETLEAVMEFGCDPKSNRGKWAQEKAESVLAAYHKGDES